MGAGELTMAYVLETTPACSYLTVDPDDRTQKIFISRDMCLPAALEKAGAVAFKPNKKQDGSVEAGSPIWLLLGRTEGSEVSWYDSVGRVERLAVNGDAFIDCPEVKQQHGTAPYVFRERAAQCRLEVGDEVRFKVHLNDKQQPQASTPMWKKYDP